MRRAQVQRACTLAYGAVQEDVERTAQEPVPLHLRNAPTGLDEGPGLRQGISVRARSGVESRRHAVPARQSEGPQCTTIRRTRASRSGSRRGWKRSGRQRQVHHRDTETRREKNQKARDLLQPLQFPSLLLPAGHGDHLVHVPELPAVARHPRNTLARTRRAVERLPANDIHQLAVLLLDLHRVRPAP